MGFSGGGSNILKAHKHDGTVVQDGGELAANVTQFGLSAGSILYSDGSNIQELGVGSASDALVVNGAGTAPEWGAAVGGGKLTLVDSQEITGSPAQHIISTFTAIPSSSVAYVLAVFSGETGGGNVRMEINNLQNGYDEDGVSYHGGTVEIMNVTGFAACNLCEDYIGDNVFATIQIQANPATDQIQGTINASGNDGWSSFSFWESTGSQTSISEVDIFEGAGKTLKVGTRLDIFKLEI